MQRRWLLECWGTTVELSLDGSLTRSEPPRWVHARVEDWLRDEDFAARKLEALGEHLGIARPWSPDRFSLEHYHEELKQRLVEAMEDGTVSVVVHDRAWARGSGARSRQPAPPAPAPAPEQPTGVTLVVRTISGHAAQDDAGFLLVGPGDQPEPVRLSGGRFERGSVRPGAYRARFRYLRTAAWSVASAPCGAEVGLTVQAPAFDDGVEVELRVRRRWDAPGEELATLRAQVAGGAASATWRHAQGAGDAAREEYVFEAIAGEKRDQSGVLRVEPHAADTVAGAKERLVQLGCECGAPGEEATPALEQALKQLQARCGFAAPTGRIDAPTAALLERLV